MRIRTFAALSLTGLAAFAASQTYTVTNLGVLGGTTSSVAYGLSQNGTVVGQSGTQAFMWTEGGGMVGLNGLGGPSSIAYGVNSAGRIVGRANLDGINYHAVLWDGSLNPTDLGTPGEFSEARAINESSTIAGTADFRGFRKTYGGAMEELPTLSGITTGMAINGAGTVAGGSDDAGGNRHAYRWSGGANLEDLGIQPGADYSLATAISDSGTAAGYSSFGATFGAWIYNGGFTPLTGLWTYENRVWGMSNPGDMVGWSWTSQNGDDRKAVIWRAGTTNALDLNTLIPGYPGWVLKTAYAVNDGGQIVGYGTFEGATRAFLLNPVPEPATAAGLGSAALVACAARRKSLQRVRRTRARP